MQSEVLASRLAQAYVGSMTERTALSSLLDALADAVAAGSFVKLTLGKPTPSAGDLKSIDLRPILVKRALKLSFTYHHQTRDVVKNHTPDEAMAMIESQLTEHFREAKLNTTAADFQLVHMATGYQLKHHAASVSAPPELAHDRAKQRLVTSENKPYLHALGISDAKGVVYKNAQDKFRQINKYIEILDGLVKQLPPRESLRIVDMGAGKGYLTFALYDYLTSTLKLKAEVVGVEYRADLVEKCNDIAANAGFKDLHFVQVSIADYDCSGADVVIALHACDTATDDAIAKAVNAGSSLIVVAPCCHKQIRREMDKKSTGQPLGFLMKFGTYVERIAEMVTDGMRAQMLEISGYKTNLFEFISDAHTPKNVMIVATKAAGDTKDVAKLSSALAATKAEFGIGYHQLERLLGL